MRLENMSEQQPGEGALSPHLEMRGCFEGLSLFAEFGMRGECDVER